MLAVSLGRGGSIGERMMHDELVRVFFEPVGSLHWGCLINGCSSRAALFLKTAARKFQGNLKFVKRLLLFAVMFSAKQNP